MGKYVLGMQSHVLSLVGSGGVESLGESRDGNVAPPLSYLDSAEGCEEVGG